MESPAERQAKISAMQISPTIQQPLTEGGFGFSKSRIRTATLHPEQTHIIRLERATIEVCATEVGDRLDLVGIGTSNDPWEVMFAFEVYSDLDATPLDEMTPREIVETLARRFGLTVAIGGESSKFFLEREIVVSRIPLPAVPLSSVLQVHNPNNCNCLLVRATGLIGNTVQAVLVFCIDADRYWQWISNR
jgi:hypothetical protein